MLNFAESIKIDPRKHIQSLISDKRSVLKTPYISIFLDEITEMSVMGLINTVLGYKKGRKPNIFFEI